MTLPRSTIQIEDTPIKTIVLFFFFIEKGKKNKRRTFLCLIGEKGKVLLTFFTEGYFRAHWLHLQRDETTKKKKYMEAEKQHRP